MSMDRWVAEVERLYADWDAAAMQKRRERASEWLKAHPEDTRTVEDLISDDQDD